LASKLRNHVTDLRGLSRMAVDATTGVADLAEALQARIARTPARLGGPLVQAPVHGIARMVYGTVRGITRAVGGGIDLVLGRAGTLLGEMDSPPGREAVLAALNGVLGDYLHDTDNPLAIPMQWRSDGRVLTPAAMAQDSALARAPRLLVLVHGLCMNDLQWQRNGHDHGAALARDLGDLGLAPIYLHYNTGRRVSTNGQLLAGQLNALAGALPGARLHILAHSMGGLVARSALHYGSLSGHDWPRRLRTMIFLGTPHHGAPLERGGHAFESLLALSGFTAPFTKLSRVRSAGIMDLRHGCLLDTDWAAQPSEPAHNQRTPVPLPADVRCHAVAAHLGAGPVSTRKRLVGDGLVPLRSALGEHDDPRYALHFAAGNTFIAAQTGHLDLLSAPPVYEQIRQWLAQ
jgi:pimeloyl-ACP methyl ester carboxylesterase